MKGSYFNQTSKYPAFSYKIPGVQNNSLEKSSEEEITLLLKLTKDVSLQ